MFLTVGCALCAGMAAFLIVMLLIGVRRLVRTMRAGDYPRAKTLGWAVLRTSLWMSAFLVMAVTRGHSAKTATMLWMIAIATRLPQDFKTLYGHRR